MRCSQAEKLISLLPELDSEKLPALQEHIAHCSACRNLARHYERLSELSRSLPAPTEPAGFYETYFQEIIGKLPSDNRTEAGVKWQRTAWRQTKFGQRYAYAFGGLGLAVVLIAVLFLSREVRDSHIQRQTLEVYLLQRDYWGLAEAMKDRRQQAQLVSDSVSVDLLVDSLRRLQRIQIRHGRAGRLLANSLAGLTGYLQPGTKKAPPGFRLHLVNLVHDDFDFDAVRKALGKIQRPGVRVSLRDLFDFVKS